MILRGLTIGIFVLSVFALSAQEASWVPVKPGEVPLKAACADQFAGTIQLGAVLAQSDRIDLADTTFLCYLDRFDVIHDGNADLTGDPDPTTQPGIGYVWYDCPPTIPGPDLLSIQMDNCILDSPLPTNGLWAFVDQFNGDATFQNAQNILGGMVTTVPDFFNGGQPFQAWFAPITFDDAGARAYESMGGGPEGPCVNSNVNEAFSVVYLNPLEVQNINITDLTGSPITGEFQVLGGLSEFDGSTYPTISIIHENNTSIRGTVLGGPHVHEDIVSFTVPQTGPYVISIEDGVSCGVSERVLISDQSDAMIFTIGDAVGNAGDVVCVPFTVENFDSIEVIQLSINVDPNVLSIKDFNDIQLIGFDPGAVVINVEQGNILLIWQDPNLFEGDGVSVPDGTKLWDLCFCLTGQPGTCSAVSITGNPLDIDIANVDAEAIDAIVNPGEVCIEPPNVLTIFASSCSSEPGTNAGSVEFSVFGGTPPYNYSGTIPAGVIATEGGSVAIGGLNPGMYTIDVVDDVGAMTSTMVTVANAPPLQVDSVFVRHPRCFGYADGRIIIEEVSGGVGPYTYNWSNFIFNDTIIRDLAQGVYTVTITDAAGCSIEHSELLETPPIVMNVTVIDSATCEGVLDGRIRIRASGGEPIGGSSYMYTVQWIDEDGQTQTSSFTGASRTLSNIGGSVMIRVEDDAMCQEEIIFDVPFKKILTAQSVGTDVQCFVDQNGRIAMDVASIGASQSLPIQYEIFNNAGTFGENAVVALSQYEFNGLGADTFNIVVTDADGCSIDTSIILTSPTELTLDFRVDGLDCSGAGNDGAITLLPDGGVTPYIYTWENNDMDSIRTGLSAAVYYVTLTDANMCEVIDTIDLTQGGNLFIDRFETTPLECASDSDGVVTVHVMSSDPNISYEWETGHMTQSVSSLPAGTYTVTVSNDSGCQVIDSVELMAPAPLEVVMVNDVSPTCPGFSDGQVGIVVQGGVPNLTYDWDYDPDPMAPVLAGIPAGEYTVTVQDGNNCQIVRNIVLSPPDSIRVDIDQASIEDVSCFGESTGQAIALASGGTLLMGYNFEWSSGETTFDPMTDTAMMLSAGEQWLLVNDNLCSTDTIFFDVGQVELIEIDDALTAITRPTCFGDSDGVVTIGAQGGDGNYSYLWLPSGTMGPTLNTASAGNLRVLITDGLGCSIIDSVVVTQPDSLEAFIDQNITMDPNCFNSTTGQIGVDHTGGNAGTFMYTWTDNVSDTDFADNLAVQTYIITVTDPQGCTDTAQYTLASTPPLNIQFTPPDEPLCLGDRTCLSVDAVSGGSGTGYRFQVNLGPLMPLDTCIEVLAGPYLLTVADSDGCTKDTSILIDQPIPFTVDLGPDTMVALGDSIQLSATISPFDRQVDSIFWSHPDVECLQADCELVEVMPGQTTIYSVLVVDANGCEASDEVLVRVEANRFIFIPNAFSPNGRDFRNTRLQIFAGIGVESIDFFRIFDRWGNLMYENTDVAVSRDGSEGWDGRFKGDIVNPGVYVYFAKVNFEDGASIIYKGSVTVLR